MQTFFPSIKTYAEHRLAVDDIHELHIEECGNPDGIPIVVLHSGPGVGCDAYHRRFFDPDVYRIILFDQRGAGRSTPHAELKNNTTHELTTDMEAIREFLNIDRWALFGGAWGSTLAILYAQKHPKRVIGMVLHSIFLARESDINWFYQNGANLVFPDYWHDFTQLLNEEEHDNIISAYHKRLTGNDELTRMAAAKCWSLWQARCFALQPHMNLVDHFSDPHFATGLATIESQYFANHCFVPENQILENIETLNGIPAYIIHGRYNIVCPLHSAWELQQKWSSAELYIVRDAGHSSKEPGIVDALIHATKKIAKRFTNPDSPL